MIIKLPSKEERHKLFGSVPPGAKIKPTTKNGMKDLQNQKNKFLFDINQVGISNVKQPVNVHSSLSPNQQTTIATFTLTSSLPYDKKGTNMSRFVEQLEQYRRQGFILDFSTLHDFVKTLSERLEQKDTQLQVEFPWFYERKGPSSDLTGLNHTQAKMKINYTQEHGFKDEVSLTCGITTLCPCSKEISEYSAHNQRGYVTMNAQLSSDYSDDIDWKQVLLHAAESNASAYIHPILKRPDEKIVTEQAYENPRFVEDIVRLVAADLYEIEWIKGFDVECRNEESIHLHDAIALLSIKK
ncbi:GTP cyclohydrolase I FolE2 [Priestia megaterium]|uniref:GTP cyclohydrolase FolE2 n=1 Tax=Priestia megaterium TaxID=1404 RepID=UPI000BF4B963|nr:GTP cyclohydrolase FolE2 [Priestia megaterium]MDF2053219.1 GTP cyclohydrolase FolE2 [Priestia megaterium]MDF2062611.1 GTP cyclohydrolase FolE2 [Priestia megaterium]PFP44212.1 GTP cyclohydrolase I FolE2 [Priestia megaterium]